MSVTFAVCHSPMGWLKLVANLNGGGGGAREVELGQLKLGLWSAACARGGMPPRRANVACK